ncbi:MAG TPA: LacI family DNA-binding transcriptional regulator [Sphingomonas sp.]|jgi:LacI family transcriptional regulator|nr:LacI family DNA-binding transcriptional regulator [Sphingomonas sp.]
MSEHDRPSAPATISDVAAAAGVSIRTVSRVLNASPKVGGVTRTRIEEIIARLGFHPNSRARGLAAGRSYLIGVVQDDPNNHVIGLLQRGIAEVCSAHGYELVVHPSRYDDPDVVENIGTFVRRSKVDGVILLPPLSELATVATALAALRLPVVALAAVRVAGHPAMVVGKEREAAAALADHLFDLGHRRIGMITGPLRFLSSDQRRRGFGEALAARGGSLVPALVCEGDYGFASGLAAARRLLALDDPPTAIFAANDIMAAAVIKVARERGIAVPGQLSVVGFDDADLASMITPALTTIRRPLAGMAADATRALIDMIAGGVDARADRVVELELVPRASSGALQVAHA